jgi:Spy/CpxP family protein refolding chaperone
MAGEDGKSPTATVQPPEVPLDQAATDLLLEQKKAEARKAIAEARKAELAALQPALPDLKVDIPEEKLDAGDKASPLSQILAYGELDDAAHRVVERIGIDLDSPGLEGSRVLLVRSLDLEADHAAYTTLMSHRKLLTDAIAEATQQMGEPGGAKTFGAFPIVGAITLAMGALPTILSLFRHNSTIRGRDFTLSAHAVAAATAAKLRAARAGVVVAGFTTVPDNQVFKDLNALQKQRDELADLQSRWRLEEAEPRGIELEAQTALLADARGKRLEALAASPPRDTGPIDHEITTIETEIAKLNSRVAVAKLNIDIAQRLLEVVDAFVTAVYATPKSGLAPVAAAAAMHEFFTGDEGRYVLFVEAAFGGGESQYDERRGKDTAEHVGGVTLSYLLTDRSGLIRSAGVSGRLAFASQKVGDAGLTRGRSQPLE